MANAPPGCAPDLDHIFWSRGPWSAKNPRRLCLGAVSIGDLSLFLDSILLLTRLARRLKCYGKMKSTFIIEGQCRIYNSSKCNNCYRPRVFGGPTVFCLCKIFFSLRSQYFAKFAISRPSKRRFSIERWLYPEILVWFFLYSYVTKATGLRSAVLPL